MTTMRLLAVLFVFLPAFAFGQTAPRAPLLMAGKQSLFQRVIARPGATLSAQSNGRDARPVPGFTVFYVYDRPAGDRIEVGRNSDGHPEGWIETEKVIDWKHTIIGTFTNPAGRQPVLFLRSEEEERLLMLDAAAGQRSEVLFSNATTPSADPGPVVAVEPLNAIDFAHQFYLMPILSAQLIEREFGPPLRLLEVVSAPADTSNSTAPVDGGKKTKEFRAGVVFVLDTTVSMQPYIDRTRDAIRAFVAAIGASPMRDNFRFGLVGYRDSLADSPGLEYATKVFAKPDFSQPLEAINQQIAAVKESPASSVGFDEDPIGGIKAAISEMDWSSLDGRYIVLITDSGARTSTHPHSLTGLNIYEIRDLASQAHIAISAIHLLTPEGRARHDHEPAAAQYQDLTQTEGRPPLYFAVPGGTAEGFARVVQDLSGLILARSAEAAGHPMAKPQRAADPAMTEAIRVVSEAMRLSYLGRLGEVKAPDILRGWTTDRDLKDPTLSSLEVRVLLTRNQLSDLAHSLQTILQAGLAGRTEPRTFFTQLRSTFAAAARDPQRIAGAANIGGMLGEYLDDLPYQSEVMDIREPDWIAMGAIAQRTVLNNIEAKLRLYDEYQANADLWVNLSGTRSPGEALFPVPLEALP